VKAFRPRSPNATEAEANPASDLQSQLERLEQGEQHRLRDRMKAFRLRPLNAAKPGANLASDLRSLVPEVVNPEVRKLHRIPSRVRRSSHNVVARQYDDQPRSQVRAKVNPNRIRHRVTTSVNGSARRRLLVQLNTGKVAEVSRLVAGPAVKRAPREKECRACRLSRSNRRRNSSSSDSRRSNETGRLPAKDRGSRKVERRGNQKKRHRPVSNNFVVITPAAPEPENFGAAFLLRRYVL